MEQNFDRRKFLTVAGTGTGAALIAGCGKKNGIDAAAGTVCDNDRGICVHGLDPNPNPPEGLGKPAKMPAFAPSYITVVILALTPDGFYSNHAFFEFSGDSNGRLQKAHEIVASVYAKNMRTGLDKVKGAIRPSMDFVKGSFNFHGQNEIFFFIEGKSVSLLPDRFISFTPYGSDGKEVAKNYAFFDAAEAKAPAGVDGKMIRLANYFTDESQAKIKDDRTYSMNIHFVLPSAGGTAMIPMIIDPDTGNGQGSEP